MSRWAPESGAPGTGAPTATQSVASQSSGTQVRGRGRRRAVRSGPPEGRTRSGWFRIIPFFMSAFLFLSALFSLFSPLPLLFLNLRLGRSWAIAAAVTNALIVAVAAGVPSLGVYLVFVATLGLAVPEFLRHRQSLERTALQTLGLMAGAGLLIIGGYAQLKGLHPIAAVRTELSGALDFVIQNLNSSGTALTPEEVEEWKKAVLLEFPSAIAIFGILLVWLNLVLVFKVNPGRVREAVGLDLGYLKRWKAPDWLVWPTLAAGATLVVDLGPVSEIGTNLFKVFMAVYAIQGLSILAFFFDLWKVVGLFRLVGYLVGLFLMLPLLLSLGFFDLWFDFRSKFRQS